MPNPIEPSRQEQAEWPEATEHYIRDLEVEVERLQAIRVAAERVVSQTTPEAAYRLHDRLIEAIEAAEAGEDDES